MKHKLDIKEGDRFGMLTIIKQVEPYRFNGKVNSRRFLCQCDCGNTTITNLNRLRLGKTKSCGCLRSKCTTNLNRPKRIREKKQIISGVYAVINNIDGGMYIGSSRNIDNRFRKHMEFCRGIKGSQGSYRLKEAVKTFGIDNFSLVILEPCEIESLLVREKFWIEKLQPTYNVSMNPLNPIQSRVKGRLKPKELWKPMLGHSQSDETKKKISNTMKGKRPSPQCLEKANKLRKKRVVLKSVDSECKVFNSLSECADYLGISIKHASLIKHDKSLFRKQFKIYDYVQMDKAI